MGMNNWRIRQPSVFVFSFTLLLNYSSVLVSGAVVTLDSIEIYKTHGWIPSKVTIFFQCKGENEIVLPDVKAKHTVFHFKGEESWQPLVELKDIKCKRCGLYQKDALNSNVEFDEWEFCASDFTSADGRYNHFKEKEFNATFLCPDCVPLGKALDYSFNLKYLKWILIPAASIVATIVVIAGLVAAFKCWQKRKRQQEQARFLKLFEDSDDIEDELGIGPLSNSL